MFQSLLKEDEANDDALIEYGRALIDAQKNVDALHVFLRVLVHRPGTVWPCNLILANYI